ncbi:hypothetical protein [Urbifossiella limnaea]|uniref:Uncharacterized protein n=1 Tax=Urbifossiella limnaea TaxID=2528023 RepID=A0A517Y1P2_9BACT|nr:hypothetical protein [Urbifossiella limnaea]QDU23675.1 hypothetical protein ETAA1_56800 [Urbifossiella limnaea]
MSNPNLTCSVTPPRDARRLAHRRLCVAAGGLAVLGAVLAIAVAPALAVLSAAGGLALLLIPDRT